MSRSDAFDTKSLTGLIQSHEPEHSKTGSTLADSRDSVRQVKITNSSDLFEPKGDPRNPQDYVKQFEQLSPEDRSLTAELMNEDLHHSMLEQRIENLPNSAEYLHSGQMRWQPKNVDQSPLESYGLEPRVREELAMLPPKEAYNKVIQEREKVNAVTNRHIEAYNRNREPGTPAIELPQGHDKLALLRNMPISQLEHNFPEVAKSFNEHGIAQMGNLVICAPGPTLCEEQEKLEQLGFVGIYDIPQNTTHHKKD